MGWQEELKNVVENGCTDSDIEDFVTEHKGVNGKDVWNYVYEYNAPKECKGCKFIQMSGLMPCIKCSRSGRIKDYYEHR